MCFAYDKESNAAKETAARVLKFCRVSKWWRLATKRINHSKKDALCAVAAMHLHCTHLAFGALESEMCRIVVLHLQSICISISCFELHLTIYPHASACAAMAIIKSTHTTTWLWALESAAITEMPLDATADGSDTRNYLLLLRILESPHVNLCSDASLAVARRASKSRARRRESLRLLTPFN